ncbi:MAG: nucleotide sugar dehydrogenase, partial [Flavobacterium sp.]
LVLGFTFKENCPDVRNTKVIDIVRELEGYNTNVSVYDPWAEPQEVLHEYGLKTTKDFNDIKDKKYEAIILTVSHDDFLNLDINSLKNVNAVLYDVKGFLKKEDVDARL